jgi:hypothetical protein
MTTMACPANADISTSYILARMDILATRVARAVARRRARDTDPNDRFRGLYISGQRAEELLSRQPPASRRALWDGDLVAALACLDQEAAAAEDRHEVVRLRLLGRDFGLTALDVELLLVAMAPDLEPRFEQLYGYLNDDVSRRRASIGLAFELCDAEPLQATMRGRLGAHSPLLSGQLLFIEDCDRPFLSRALRVPDRVVAHLLGSDEPDPSLLPVLAPAVPGGRGTELIAAAFRGGTSLVYVREGVHSAAKSFVAASLEQAGTPGVFVDLDHCSGGNSASLAATAAREARLCGGALVVSGLDGLRQDDATQIRQWAGVPGLVVLIGSKCWDPYWARRAPLVVEAPARSDGDRQADWARSLEGSGAPEQPLQDAVAAYRMAPEQVALAASAARQLARSRGERVSREDILQGARSQNAAGLEQLARRRGPAASWSDLVLPEGAKAALRSLSARVRHGQRVYQQWGLGGSSQIRGVTGLFTGESGTGKTMAAEVVAGSLGLDLYIIELSTVVDKYIGETEKNLDRIFVEAERVNGVLLFDEADAIFGKRSEVKDARDRYANIEVAYLLQRMEQFRGVALLTTNLRANIDDAFLRRIDMLVEFPLPDQQGRAEIWRKQLGRGVPLAPDVDIDFLANAFELSGGNIRNIVLTAAFDAAEKDTSLSMQHLVHAVASEYRKLGRLCVEPEFGSYLGAVRRQASESRRAVSAARTV